MARLLEMLPMAHTWDGVSQDTPTPLHIRQIGFEDLRLALRLGWRDFQAIPTQIAFLCLIYPLVGLVMGRAASGGDLLPLIYPMLSGFVLVGPLAALGIYELSRRIEAGQQPSWSDMFNVLRSPALVSILGMGIVLLAVFTGWLGVHQFYLGRTRWGVAYLALLLGALPTVGLSGLLLALFLLIDLFAIPSYTDASNRRLRGILS